MKITIRMVDGVEINLTNLLEEELDIKKIGDMIVKSKQNSTRFIRFSFENGKDNLIAVDKIIHILKEPWVLLFPKHYSSKSQYRGLLSHTIDYAK